MPDQDQNVEFFLRSIQERFEKLKRDFNRLTTTLCAEKLEDKQKAAKAALISSTAMLEIVSTTDHPGWLVRLKSELERYISTYQSPEASDRLIQQLLNTYGQLNSHKWQFDRVSESKPVEFEVIYKEQYQNSDIPNLFDNLINQLQDIVDSGEVDSLRAIGALNRLISTIRSNMRGTYFQTVGTARFTHAVFRNFLRELLQDIPGIGPLTKAIEKTIQELDIEMSRVHSEVRQKLENDAYGEISTLTYEDHDMKIPNKKNKEDA